MADARDHFAQDRWGERVVEVEHGVALGQRYAARVSACDLDPKELLEAPRLLQLVCR